MKWSDIQHKASSEAVEQAHKDQERRYNRPWWRLVRLWDRLTSRN